MKRMNFTMPVIGILRGIEADFFRQIVTTSFDAGLQAIEVTMNTRGGLGMMRECRELVKEGQLLGMGTICNVEDAKKAIDAGAMFIVTPNFSAEVVEYGVAHHVPVIAGALTPTEIYNAWSAGAAMIKVFPCQAMGGPRYIKDLRGPFGEIPLAAVGGVSHENVSEYFDAGVQAVGVSSTLFGRRALAGQDVAGVVENIKKFTSVVAQITQGLD